MVWLASSASRREQFLAATQPIGRMVEQVVRDAIASNELEDHGQDPLTFSIGQWSMSMGMHTLIHADGILDMYDLKDPHRLLLRNVQLHLSAMQWQPLDDQPFDDAALNSKVAYLCDYLFADVCREKGSSLTLGSA